MSLTDDILEKHESIEQAKREHAKAPNGWEPVVETTGDKGIAVTPALEVPNADEEFLIKQWELDPEDWKIDGNVGVRRWQTANGNWLYSYKADLVKRSQGVQEEIPDYDELIKEIKKAKPSKKPAPTGEMAFVVCIADSQVGKIDGGGVEGTVARFLEDIESVVERVKDLRKLGRDIGTLYVLGLGDIIEACFGSYPSQQFTVELNMRDQVKLARRIILKAIKRWAPLFDKVVVAAIGGNHGAASRISGKPVTDPGDNQDVAVFEQVVELLQENPEAYGHVSSFIPNDEMSLTLDICGTITTITHGHITKGGSDPAKKLMNWWKDQAHGMLPAGESTLLLTGHYHHLIVVQDGAKTFIQCPALEGGSDWWRNLAGQESPPGLLSLVVGKGEWQDLQVL